LSVIAIIPQLMLSITIQISFSVSLPLFA